MLGEVQISMTCSGLRLNFFRRVPLRTTVTLRGPRRRGRVSVCRRDIAQTMSGPYNLAEARGVAWAAPHTLPYGL